MFSIDKINFPGTDNSSSFLTYCNSTPVQLAVCVHIRDLRFNNKGAFKHIKDKRL